MANYTQTTSFSDKDSLPSGDPEKKILGSDVDAEFANIQSAVNSKADNDLSNLTTAGENFILSLGVPTGTVVPFSSSTVPDGWLLCDGSAVSRTTYAALHLLYANDSYPYGDGDESTTFNLPDLRGRVVAGVDNMNNSAGTGGGDAARLTSGSKAGVDGDTLGDTGGVEEHTLTHLESGLPSHTHTYLQHNEDTSTLLGSGSRLQLRYTRTTENTGSAGGTNASQAHTNVQPTIVLNYIVKT